MGLRKLNELLPHDVYEAPNCDLCLEWLAGRPYRTTMDCRWGFHQVAFSELASRVITFVTPFGSFCYNRLLMGYINASAEFQRHVNNTLGPLLWSSALSMVGDKSKQEHRQSNLAVWGCFACRGHSLKPEKVNTLRHEVEYLSHISTPTGLKPTTKHVRSIVGMPPPLGKDGVTIDKTKLRSYLGMVKYSRRYIKNCASVCEPLNNLLADGSNRLM